MTAATVIHRSAEDDRCACGAMTVYWDDPDQDGFTGDGCETAGVYPRIRRQAVCHLCDLPILDAAHGRMADPAFWDRHPLGCRPEFLVHLVCGHADGMEETR